MKNWIQLMIRFRLGVIIGVGFLTLLAMFQLKSLAIIIDSDDSLPQNNPYVVTSNIIEKTFGNKYAVVIGLTATEGSIYKASFLEKVERITKKLSQTPGVVRSNISSLSARKSKAITGNAEGMIVTPLMDRVPQSQQDMDRLRAAVLANPVYKNLLVSADEKTTQIVAEFKKVPGGFKTIDNAVNEIVDPERDSTVDISTGGLPIFLATLEKFSARMAFLFPLALLIIGIIHYEAFRTFQALVLPLVTALVAVIWALGILAFTGQPMDVFNASTPILILAIAAGHAVQILKRYYEEFSVLKRSSPDLPAREMSRQAVLISLSKVGPVMVVACAVAALGFFSLIIFDIKSIRTFGIFTGSGVIAALILELTLIPALRSVLPPPGDKEFRREKERSFWDSIVDKFYYLASEKRRQVYIVSAGLILLLSAGGYFLEINSAAKSYYSKSVRARSDDEKLNKSMAGTNTIFMLVDSGVQDGIKNPSVLAGMDKMQQFFEKESYVGKSISMVNFIKQMNQSMNEDKREMYSIPASQELVAQYLLLYSNSGEPGDFDSYVDNDYQKANLQVFMKTDSTKVIDDLAKRAQAYAQTVFPATVKTSIGGGATGGAALNEVMVREKILNILQIMGAVFLVSSLVFRSFTAGFLILVPLIAAVFVNFGVMGLLGIPLNISTALVSAMAVGIGADYGIYMSYRMREELRSNLNEKEAIEKSFKSAGKAALFVSSAVAGGFGVLMLSNGFMMHIWMGFLIALAMLVSSVAALTIFPSLILTLRPKFIFENKRSGK